jgi:hypothetical protein
VAAIRCVRGGRTWSDPAHARAANDFDGDGATDLAVYHQAAGDWYVRYSSDGGYLLGFNMGWEETVPVPGDYDGDGKNDVAVWQPGSQIWFVLPSASPGTYTWTQWGMNASDLPLTGDYDLDGKADFGFRRSGIGWWYIRSSRSGATLGPVDWGYPTDVALSATTGILRAVP